MSRPPAPPPIHPPSSSTTTTQMAMTETQNLPHFPPPPYLGDPYRRLPQPVQLPPLSVPRDPVRPDFPPFFSPSQRSLPSIHSLPTTASAPSQSRPEQHRSQTRSSAPVDKLLSSNPYTPPRSEPPYSPLQYGRTISPRSQVEARAPPPRQVAARYPDEPRPVHQEPAYIPPGNPPPPPPQRQQSYQPLPSPNYTSSYPPSNASFRGSIDSHRGSAASSYGVAASYPEPAAPITAQRPPPPPPPATAASVGPNIVPNAPYRGPQQDKTYATISS